MNAGKSTILLQASHNYLERGMSTLLLKPAIDDRDGGGDIISSRIGLTSTAECFDAGTNLEDFVLSVHHKDTLDCVLVDEAQFLTLSQVWQLSHVADKLRIPVMCYGLRTDFRGELFPGSAALLALADNVKEIKTLCWCGGKATMTLRVDGDGEADTGGTQIEIGGNERYVSLCRKHWVGKHSEPPK